MYYYLILEIMLNSGRPIITVTTIALANTYSHSNSRRDRLINNRNSFAFIGNCTVLLVAFVVFILKDNQEE